MGTLWDEKTPGGGWSPGQWRRERGRLVRGPRQRPVWAPDDAGDEDVRDHLEQLGYYDTDLDAP